MQGREQIIRLGKVLAAEQRRGCNDSSTEDGLEAFLGAWEAEADGALSVPTVRNALEMLHGYNAMTTGERRTRVLRAVEDLRALFRTDAEQDAGNKGTKEQRNKGTKEQRNKGTKEQRNSEQRTEEQRNSEQRTEEQRNSEQRTEEQRTEEQRNSEQRTANSEQRTASALLTTDQSLATADHHPPTADHRPLSLSKGGIDHELRTSYRPTK